MNEFLLFFYEPKLQKSCIMFAELGDFVFLLHFKCFYRFSLCCCCLNSKQQLLYSKHEIMQMFTASTSPRRHKSRLCLTQIALYQHWFLCLLYGGVRFLWKSILSDVENNCCTAQSTSMNLSLLFASFITTFHINSNSTALCGPSGLYFPLLELTVDNSIS